MCWGKVRGVKNLEVDWKLVYGGEKEGVGDKEGEELKKRRFRQNFLNKTVTPFELKYYQISRKFDDKWKSHNNWKQLFLI